MSDEPVLVLVHLPDGPPGGGQAELAAGVLWAEGATAVEVREGAEGITLLAGYPTADAARDVARRLGRSLGATAESVTDTTWQDAWREWVHPVPVGRSLLVVPAWRPVPVGTGRLSLEIDSGACFGSGTHPSTRLILTWLDAHPPVGADVLDVGTGSGILAVAAARLGARSVTAVDIDPEAVAVTNTNATRNGVAGQVRVSTTPVEQIPAESADVVLVNVTAGTHVAIGTHSAAASRPGGHVLVAGLLPGQWRHVRGTYRDLVLVEQVELDGWEGAVLKRDR